MGGHRIHRRSGIGQPHDQTGHIGLIKGGGVIKRPQAGGGGVITTSRPGALQQANPVQANINIDGAQFMQVNYNPAAGGGPGGQQQQVWLKDAINFSLKSYIL